MEFTNLFVVYDPTRKEQPALDRATAIARETGASLHLFACIYLQSAKPGDPEHEREKLLAAQQAELDERTRPLLADGIRVTTGLEWEKDWYHAVVRAAAGQGADLVLKSSYRHSSQQRIMNRTSDWTLIRECQCPVLLVKEGDKRDFLKVLAAVDIREQRESHGDLNQHIIDLSKRIMHNHGADVHFVNAHKDLASFPDRNALIKACGASNDRIHIKLGDTDDVIVEHARKLDVGLVVVGNSARTGLSAAVRGNTVEKVLDKLECDLLSMP